MSNSVVLKLSISNFSAIFPFQAPSLICGTEFSVPAYLRPSCGAGSSCYSPWTLSQVFKTLRQRCFTHCSMSSDLLIVPVPRCMYKLTHNPLKTEKTKQNKTAVQSDSWILLKLFKLILPWMTDVHYQLAQIVNCRKIAEITQSSDKLHTWFPVITDISVV